MKRILITGENSYVGTSFTNYLNKHYPNDYQIDEISVRDDSWVDKDFSSYDVVFHVAGIVHIKETKENEHLYYKVNQDLAINVASKAKREKVKQFIFLSTMSVYGIDQGAIDKDTPTNPKTAYGKSKLQAEIEIDKLNNDHFKIAILRPPMVYGPGSKGNYPKLSKLAKITPIFPDYPNKRSMIFIDNLTIFIKEITDNNLSGLFLPQNNGYVNTTEMVQEIVKVNNKNIYKSKLFHPLIKLLMKVTVINKVFGNLYYKKTQNNPNFYTFSQSIKITEGLNEK